MRSMEGLDIDYPNIRYNDKLKGFIDFKKQCPRLAFEKLQEKGNPHEKRFDKIDFFPSISSKSPRNTMGDFSKLRPRKGK